MLLLWNLVSLRAEDTDFTRQWTRTNKCRGFGIVNLDSAGNVIALNGDSTIAKYDAGTGKRLWSRDVDKIDLRRFVAGTFLDLLLVDRNDNVFAIGREAEFFYSTKVYRFSPEGFLTWYNDSAGFMRDAAIDANGDLLDSSP